MPFDRPDPLDGITRAQVVTFFDGLELAEPGLGSTPQWRPGAGVPRGRCRAGREWPARPDRPQATVFSRPGLAQEPVGRGVGLAAEVLAEDLGERRPRVTRVHLTRVRVTRVRGFGPEEQGHR